MAWWRKGQETFSDRLNAGNGKDWILESTGTGQIAVPWNHHCPDELSSLVSSHPGYYATSISSKLTRSIANPAHSSSPRVPPSSLPSPRAEPLPRVVPPPPVPLLPQVAPLPPLLRRRRRRRRRSRTTTWASVSLTKRIALSPSTFSP